MEMKTEDRYYAVIRKCFIYSILLMVAMGIIMTFFVIQSNAEGLVEYHLSVSSELNGDGSYGDSTIALEASFESAHPLFLYLQNRGGLFSEYPHTYNVGVYFPDFGECLIVKDSIPEKYNSAIVNTLYLRTDYKWVEKDGQREKTKVKDYDFTGRGLTTLVNFIVHSDADLHTDAYVFESLEAAQNFYLTGNRDGLIQDALPDYDYDHDFRDDIYDPDIAVPELSNLSFNGFHVNNADPTRDIEIYMTSTFYGVKHSYADSTTISRLPNPSSSVYQVDTSAVVGTHRFNLINTDISYSDADIDIKRMYKVDNVFVLCDDFKRWSKNYPSHKSLSDYSFFKYSDPIYNNSYVAFHNYDSCFGNTDEEKLVNSGQASVTYFVRFCQYVPGSGYTYGQWVSYTYMPGGFTGRDKVTIGDVAIDPATGDPSVSNPNTGIQDKNGNIDYSFDSDFSTFDASQLWSFIEDLVAGISVVPGLISEVLSFFPNWILGMIVAGIGAIVILRFVGR